MFHSSFYSTWYSHFRAILVSWVGEGAHEFASHHFSHPLTVCPSAGLFGWPKSYLGLSMASYRETQTTHLASPIVLLPPFVFYLWTFFWCLSSSKIVSSIPFLLYSHFGEVWKIKHVFDLLYLTGITAINISPHVESVQFSLTDSLRPHGLQHTRLPCPSPTSGAYSSSCLLHQWLVFPSESVLCIRWPKYWSFSFNISPSNEYSGLISFRIDLLDLLDVQETLKSLLQHHSSKASIIWCSAFFIVQLSHLYMTTGKTIALTKQTFVGKVMNAVCMHAVYIL